MEEAVGDGSAVGEVDSDGLVVSVGVDDSDVGLSEGSEPVDGSDDVVSSGALVVPSVGDSDAGGADGTVPGWSASITARIASSNSSSRS